MEVVIAATPPKTSPTSPRSPMEKRGEAVERGSRRARSGLSMPGHEVVSRTPRQSVQLNYALPTAGPLARPLPNSMRCGPPPPPRLLRRVVTCGPWSRVLGISGGTSRRGSRWLESVGQERCRRARQHVAWQSRYSRTHRGRPGVGCWSPGSYFGAMSTSTARPSRCRVRSASTRRGFTTRPSGS